MEHQVNAKQKRLEKMSKDPQIYDKVRLIL